MMDGVLRSLFSMLNVDPEEVKKMIFDVTNGVQSVENDLAEIKMRLAEIERKLDEKV